MSKDVVGIGWLVRDFQDHKIRSRDSLSRIESTIPTSYHPLPAKALQQNLTSVYMREERCNLFLPRPLFGDLCNVEE